MATAMVYARVSTAVQGDNYSLPTQLDMCRKHCERKGYRIVSEWTDTHSGTELNRPGMNALLDAVAVQKPDAVVFLDVDRLGRETMVQAVLEADLTAYGARIEFVNGGTIGLGGDGTDEMMVDFKKLLAKQENRIRVERSRRGKRGRVESGNPMPTGGKAPYGFDYVSTGKHTGDFVINEQEADIVRKIFDWLVLDRLSSYQIAQRIHAMGVPSRGDVSSVAKKNGFADWSPTTIRRIVVNTVYRGEWIWGKFRHVKQNGKRRAIPVPEDQWVKVAVPAIVDTAIWNAAQLRLSENKANATRNTKREYLLRGFIFCTCGRRWTGRFKTNVQRAYYRCGACEAETWRNNCDARWSYKVDELDNAVWGKVTEYLLQPDTMLQEIRRQREASTVEAAKRNRRLTAARKEVAEVERKLTALLDNALSGAFPMSILDSKRVELLERRTDAMNAVARLENEQQAVDITPDTEAALLALSRTMQDALPAMAFAEKRKVLELLRTRIEVIDKDTVRLSGLITNGAVLNTSCLWPR